MKNDWDAFVTCLGSLGEVWGRYVLEMFGEVVGTCLGVLAGGLCKLFEIVLGKVF